MRGKGGVDENPIKTLKLTGKINQLLVCVRWLKYWWTCHSVLYSDLILVIALYHRLQNESDIFRVKTVFDNLSNFYHHGRYLYLLISERKLTQIYFHVNEKLVIWMLDKIVLYIFPKSKLIVCLFKKKGKIMTFLLHINGRKLTFYLVITVIMLRSLKDIF